MAQRDYYEILGVERTIDAAGLKSAYRKLAMTHHPDRNGGDRSYEKALQRTVSAYTQLRNSPYFRDSK